MSIAPRKHSDAPEAALPYMEPDFCEEPKTEPRIRTQLLIPTEQSGVVPRVHTLLTQAQSTLTRLRFVPALLIGALIGSAPYVVHQYLHSHAVDELRTLGQAHAADVETTQLAAANAPGSAAPQLYAAAAAQPAELLPSSPQPLAAPSYIQNATAVGSVEPHHSRLTLERALLGLARRQLKSGDGLGAQLALERLNKTVPHGTQIQQRKWLEIQVLLAIGAKDRARTAARDFARAYPHSPKLAKLSGLLLGT